MLHPMIMEIVRVACIAGLVNEAVAAERDEIAHPVIDFGIALNALSAVGVNPIVLEDVEEAVEGTDLHDDSGASAGAPVVHAVMGGDTIGPEAIAVHAIVCSGVLHN